MLWYAIHLLLLTSTRPPEIVLKAMILFNFDMPILFELSLRLLVIFISFSIFEWIEDEVENEAANAADASAEGETQGPGYYEDRYRYCGMCQKTDIIGLSWEHELAISAIVLAGVNIPPGPAHSLISVLVFVQAKMIGTTLPYVHPKEASEECQWKLSNVSASSRGTMRLEMIVRGI
jgi:hypothetical protein